MNEVKKLAEMASLQIQIKSYSEERRLVLVISLWHKTYFLWPTYSSFSSKKIWNPTLDIFGLGGTAIAAGFFFQI